VDDDDAVGVGAREMGLREFVPTAPVCREDGIKADAEARRAVSSNRRGLVVNIFWSFVRCSKIWSSRD
jgi:hypothetical protein